MDLTKLMATAVKKFHEDRDANYISQLNDGNYIRGDTGMLNDPTIYSNRIQHHIQ